VPAPPSQASGYTVLRKLAGEASFRQMAVVPVGFAAIHGYADSTAPPSRHEYAVQAIEGDPAAPITVVAGAPQLWTAQTVEYVFVSQNGIRLTS
jgi:hypothetical protein